MDKEEKYIELVKQVDSLTDGVDNPVAVMANTSAAIASPFMFRPPPDTDCLEQHRLLISSPLVFPNLLFPFPDASVPFRPPPAAFQSTGLFSPLPTFSHQTISLSVLFRPYILNVPQEL